MDEFGFTSVSKMNLDKVIEFGAVISVAVWPPSCVAEFRVDDNDLEDKGRVEEVSLNPADEPCEPTPTLCPSLFDGEELAGEKKLEDDELAAMELADEFIPPLMSLPGPAVLASELLASELLDPLSVPPLIERLLLLGRLVMEDSEDALENEDESCLETFWAATLATDKAATNKTPIFQAAENIYPTYCIIRTLVYGGLRDSHP